MEAVPMDQSTETAPGAPLEHKIAFVPTSDGIKIHFAENFHKVSNAPIEVQEIANEAPADSVNMNVDETAQSEAAKVENPDAEAESSSDSEDGSDSEDSSSSDSSSSSSSSSSCSSSEDQIKQILKQKRLAAQKAAGEGGNQDGDDTAERPAKRQKKQPKRDIDALDGDGDDIGGDELLRTQNEIVNVKPDQIDVVIAEDEPIEIIGHIMHIVDGYCVVRSSPGRPALDLDSLLCLQDRKLIGRVFETFGQVHDPFYSVLIQSEAQNKASNSGKKRQQRDVQPAAPSEIVATTETIPAHEEKKESTPAVDCMEVSAPQDHHGTTTTAEAPLAEKQPDQSLVSTSTDVKPEETKIEIVETKETDSTNVEVSGSLLTDALLEPKLASLSDLAVGQEVFFVKTYTTFVRPENLYTKGYDASNEFDEEVPEDQLEFSDDEKEMAAKRAKRKRNAAATEEDPDAAIVAEMEAEMAQDPDNPSVTTAVPSQAQRGGRGGGRGGRGRGRGGRGGAQQGQQTQQTDANIATQQQQQAYAYQMYYGGYGMYPQPMMMMPAPYGYPQQMAYGYPMYPQAMPGYHPQQQQQQQQQPPQSGPPQ